MAELVLDKATEVVNFANLDFIIQQIRLNLNIDSIIVGDCLALNLKSDNYIDIYGNDHHVCDFKCNFEFWSSGDNQKEKVVFALLKFLYFLSTENHSLGALYKISYTGNSASSLWLSKV